MLKKILGTIGILVLLIVVIALTKPSEFKVERSITISAPPEKAFVLINNFHKWNDWSPWAKLDPNAKNTFDGPTAGVGAKFSWDGNFEVGKGSMTIAESNLNSLVRINMEFIEPLAGTGVVEFLFVPEGAQTKLTWAMTGKNNFIGKLMSIFMDCDKMVGTQYEKGLAQIKSMAESALPSGNASN